MKRKVFIGVAWPYVNGDIHIGHLAGYLLPADIYARFNRFIGNEVLMVSGSDCFGTPVTLEAEERRTTAKKIADEYHKKNLKLFEILNLTFDTYTRTDTENHAKIAQDFFLKFLRDGLIFKDKTLQYFSPEEKKFLPDRYVEGECLRCGYEFARSDQCDNCGAILNESELKNPRSKISGKPVEFKETEHYFFDWPKLQNFLENYVGSKTDWREWVRNETLGWLKEGLKPRPITRDLEWGAEIPIDKIPQDMKIENTEHKRIYVWFEAVIGYLSASIEWAEKNGKKWKDFWYNPKSYHAYFMGKDNLIFHTLFWPGELHIYDEKLHLPDFPAINQFLTLEGQKFSKSRGITIDSKYIVEKYGLDPVRFYLCFINPESADANFSWADFASKTNNILIANFGNFVNRTLTLAKDCNFGESFKIEKDLEAYVLKLINETKKSLGDFEFKKYAEIIVQLSDFGNKYLSKKEPWLIKNREEKEFKETIYNSLFIVLALLLISKPLLINSAKKISKFLQIEIKKWPHDEINELKKLLKKVKIKKPKPLFKKIEKETIQKELAKLR